MFKRIFSFLLICCLVITFLLSVSPASAQVIDDAPKDEGGVGLGAPIASGDPEPSSFANYTNRIYQFAVVIGISLAVLMIIFAGYKYMSSAGDPQSMAEAKEILIGAIVGLVLILLTRLILASIDPELLEFPRHAPNLGSSGTTVSADLETKAKELCQEKKKEISSADWQKGPCLTKDLEGSGYAVDVVHRTRIDADDEEANTCGSEHLRKKLIEYDLDCELVWKND